MSKAHILASGDPIAFLAQIRHTKKRDDLFWKVAAFTKNHWKFHLDSVVPSGGQDRILAIIDDDSCLLDHFVLDDIVGMCLCL
jgi:hypothetical protein